MAESNVCAHESRIARTNGFNLLGEIAAAAKGSPQPSPSVGSELTVEVLKCIFDVTDTLVIKPIPTATSFTPALDHAAGGGYEVVGQQRSPGYDLSGVGRPMIYRWSDDVRGQVKKLFP